MTDPEVLARAQGTFNLLGGAWPIVHRQSFEALFGRKDVEYRWLQQTVGGLLVAAGWNQIRSAGTPEGQLHARRAGLGIASTFLAIDLIYVPQARIRWTYLLDAAAEVFWIGAWLRSARKTRLRAATERAARAGRAEFAAGAPGRVTAEHVARLLATEDPGAALVAVGGRVEIVSSGETPGGLVVAEREEVLRTLPEGDRSPEALQRVARALDTAVSGMGG